MQLAQIRMQSTNAQIGMNVQDPVQHLSQPKAVQRIEQPQAKQHIEITPGKLSIDQTAAWEAVDIKPITKRTAEYAQKGREKATEGIKRRARQGNELMMIEKGGNVLRSQAIENGHRAPKQFNVGWLPPVNSVKFHYEQAKVNIDAETYKPRIDVQVSKVTHDYKPGEVTTYLRQKNSLQIDVVNV